MGWAEKVKQLEAAKREPYLILACPNNRDTQPNVFAKSFHYMEKPEGVKTHYCWPVASSVDHMRNLAVEDALKAGATHLMFVDADMVCPRDGITRLWAHVQAGHKIVSALAWRRAGAIHPCVYSWDEAASMFKALPPDDWFGKKELIEVDGVGSACIIIDMEIYRRMAPPWYEFRKLDTGITQGEDLAFCAKARALGYKIMVDASITFGHLIQETYFGEDGIVCAGKHRYMPLEWIASDENTLPEWLQKHLPRGK